MTNAAGALTTGLLLDGTMRGQSPNNRINLALIGGRSEGRAVALRMIEQGARIKTFCDIDEAVLDKVNPDFQKAQNVAPATVKDFRRVLDDKSIDAVVIATPDHWHTHIALQALQAGKDVYVEKPLCQTITEGQLIREATRKYNRVVQVGTQRRSGVHFQSAADYVASGKLGKVCLVKAWMVQTRKTIGNPPDAPPPATVDYDVWLGPAPKRPFNENRFHYNWRFFWDYGNTELGNQGIHLLDVALSGIQKMKGQEKVLPKSISGHGGIYWLDDAKEVPDTQVTTYDFGDLLLTWELRSFGTAHLIDGVAAGTGFYGTEGSLILDGSGWKVYTKEGQPPAMEVEASGGSHEGNFLDCMRSRKRPNSDVEIGRLSTMLCHLGNILPSGGTHYSVRPCDRNVRQRSRGKCLSDQAVPRFVSSAQSFNSKGVIMPTAFKRSLLFTLVFVPLGWSEIRIGIIGTDTSHVVAFTRVLNDATNPDHISGFRVTAAVKGGSKDIPSSLSRVEGYADEIHTKWNVELVPDIAALSGKVDAIILESLDGRVHLQQAKQAFALHKPMFIDKPLASTLDDALEILKLGKEAKVPWFSASSLRFGELVASVKSPDAIGISVWGPGPVEEHHALDLTWYGVHPVEMLYALMGAGCDTVARISGGTDASGTDVITGRWKDGRIGTVRVIRPTSGYGAVAYGPKEIRQGRTDVAPFTYVLLLKEIVKFFETRVPLFRMKKP